MIIKIAQINPIVGDLNFNLMTIIDIMNQSGEELVVFPEASLLGYPIMDLNLDNSFIEKQLFLVYETIPNQIGKNQSCLVGFVERINNKLYSACAFISENRVQRVILKTLLPTYSVFDEARWYTPAPSNQVPIIEYCGHTIGIMICEDMWDDDYDFKPIEEIMKRNPDLIINISASPWSVGKREKRIELAKSHAKKAECPFIYVNMVGGQDELIFDGSSFIVNENGNLDLLAPQFQEGCVQVEYAAGRFGLSIMYVSAEEDNKFKYDIKPEEYGANGIEEVHDALIFGIKEYCRKNGFEKAVLGLSGGVDSALVAYLAAMALGSKNVQAIYMPSDFSSDLSRELSEKLAKNLGLCYNTVDIQKAVSLSKDRFKASFGEYKSKLTIENLQARERAKILMEFSNDRNAILLTTGNKTEIALNYSTLYGDSAGGLSVIGDLNKRQVYAMCRYINSIEEIIPNEILERKPSAELAEGQVDPFDYDKISDFVDKVMAHEMSFSELEHELGKEVASDIFKRIRLSEYKRFQSAPILKVSERAFGIGRKMPITNKFKPEE